jgi:broad specificity phosphatase PhoE
METATIISQTIDVPVIGEPLLYEEKTPTSIQGLVHEKAPDNPIEQYLRALLAHSEEPDYHYADDENLWERRERIKKILVYLTDMSYERAVVVSHGNILKMLVAYIILGQQGTAKDLYLSSQTLKTANTGITQLIYEADQWRVLIWNDHAHFAD